MASDDRRHQTEEKTYAVLTPDSINAMAESAGHEPIPHEAAVALGEDVSYRLRQVINLATQFMKHARRRRLTCEDFNRAVKELGLMPVHGHGSQEPAVFRHVKEADIYCVDDPELDLAEIALSDYVPKQIGQTSIKAHWLAVEGVIKISAGASSSSQGKGAREMSETYLKYYNAMTKSLLSSDFEARKKALQDLKTNPNLVPVLPYLVNFVVSGIKNLSHDIGHLTTLLNTVRALIHNKSLYLLHKPYLSMIVQGVEFCVLEPLAASINFANDHWMLRDYAARLLAEIVNRWTSPQNHLRFNTIKCLKEVLHDTCRPFYSHYGAVMTLVALGNKAVEDVILPYLPTYWPHLKNAMEDGSPECAVARSDSHKVYGALRLAAEKVIRRYIRKFKEFSDAHKEKEEILELVGPDDEGSKDLPGSSKDKNLPGSSKDKDLPGSSKDKDLPGCSKDKDLPGSSKGKDLPGSSKDKDLPGTSKGKDLPGSSKGKDLPGSSKGKDLPGSSKGKDLPGSSKDEGASRRKTPEKDVNKIYMELYEYFGDSLAHCLPIVETQNIFKPKKKDDMVVLTDSNTGKSSEELLDNLMEQIKVQEKLEQERKERELLEQKEREKRERERRARQAIEMRKREEEERKRRQKKDEEDQRRKRLYMEEAERQRKLREEEEKRKKEWDDQIKELNRNRSKPQWQQEIELRRLQLEEEMQYSRSLEAKKRQERRDRARVEGEEEKLRKQKEEEEELRRKEEEDEQAGRSRVGLRRRKPVNYTEKDEDISDLFEETAKKARLAKAAAHQPRVNPVNPALPPHSDISDDSDGDLSRRIAAGSLSPATAEAIAVSKMIDPSKGLLKLKIKRQSTHASTPPHPMSATPQHQPSAYHSPSMLSPRCSPHSGSHSTPPPPVSVSYPRSKSSSGSEKESKHKKGSTSSKHSRAGSTGIQDISDPDEPFYERPQGSIPPQLYSPGGGESSGSDSNPHRKALKLKLKLTPKDSASE